MAEIFSGVFGGAAMKAFWYHFAIMFEALFILTTVDAGTRVGRFMLQDMLGNVWKPIGRVSWKPGIWVTSAVMVGLWGYFLYVGATDPLGGINQLFPLFGIANQLLAAIALTVCTTLLIKAGRLRWAWVTGIPLAWDLAVTFTAGWQKIFDSDPKIGFFAQRERYAEALEAGEVLAPAKSLDDMETVVLNSTVDGVIMAVFLLLVVLVVGHAAVICVRAVRSPVPLPTTEAPTPSPPSPSRLPGPRRRPARAPRRGTRRERDAASGAAGSAGPGRATSGSAGLAGAPSPSAGPVGAGGPLVPAGDLGHRRLRTTLPAAPGAAPGRTGAHPAGVREAPVPPPREQPAGPLLLSERRHPRQPLGGAGNSRERRPVAGASHG